MKINRSVEISNIWLPPKRKMSALCLDLNENYILSNFILDGFKNKLVDMASVCYPEYDYLLSLLGNYCGLPQQEILLTNGADQAIEIVIRLCFKPNDLVLIPSPVFSYYYHVLKLCEVQALPIPYHKKNFEYIFPYHELVEQLPNAKGLILCHPNNPLGGMICEVELKILIKLCNELEIPIIVDEAYYEYCQHTCADLINQYPTLFVIRTFSKYFGLAGLRLGYILANAALIKQMLKIRGPWDVNYAAVKMGEYCLENVSSIHTLMQESWQSKQLLMHAFEKVGIKTYASDANFILLKDTPHQYWLRYLQSQQIEVADLSHYPHSFNLLKNILRMGIPPMKWAYKIAETLDKSVIRSVNE